jgi:hypothetical protein
MEAMMRSKYVYLIFHDGVVLSVHTVKREAIEWFRASEWLVGDVALCRMSDGGVNGEHQTLVPLELS